MLVSVLIVKSQNSSSITSSLLMILFKRHIITLKNVSSAIHILTVPSCFLTVLLTVVPLIITQEKDEMLMENMRHNEIRHTDRVPEQERGLAL